MARVEFPPPADLTMDSQGNVLSGRSVTAKLAGTATNVTHYSALTGGTSTTGGLFTYTDGTIVDGSNNRRYVDSGITMDITIAGRTRQVEAISAASLLPAAIDATNPVANLQMLAYVSSTGKFIFKNPFFIDPADGSWGTVSSSSDCVATFQAAVNFAIMGNTTDPALAAAKPMATRLAQWPVKTSIGTYRFDSKLKIYGVHGLRFEGSGEHTTHFVAGSVGQDHVLDINGCGNSTFAEFTLETDTGTVATCTSLMNVDSLSTVSKNSGPYNTFKNIRGYGKCVYGTTVGALGPSNAQDTYHHKFYNVLMYGQQRFPVNFTATTTNLSTSITSVSNTTATVDGIRNGDTITGTGIPSNTTVVSGQGTATLVLSNAATASNVGMGLTRAGWDDATWWQAGFKLGGNFGQANVLEHSFVGCNVANWLYGVHTSTVSCHWDKGSMQANGTDIHIAGANWGGPMVFENFRGERSGRLLGGTNGAVLSQVTLRNIGWGTPFLASDNIFLRFNFGGHLVVDNVVLNGMVLAQAREPVVNIGSPSAGQSVEFRSCSWEALDGDAHPQNWITSSAPREMTWTVINQGCATIGASGLMEKKPIPGPLSNRDRIAPLMSFSATLNSTTLLVSGNSTASAQVRIGQTISGTNIPAATTVTAVSGNNITLSAAATGSGVITAALVAYTANPADKYIGVASTVTGGATVNLPAVATFHPGHDLVVKDESGTAATNNITIDGSGAETIDGAATNVISTNYGSRRLKCTGTAWVVI